MNKDYIFGTVLYSLLYLTIGLFILNIFYCESMLSETYYIDYTLKDQIRIFLYLQGIIIIFFRDKILRLMINIKELIK